MRVSSIQNQQIYTERTFKGKKAKAGSIIGGIAGLAMCGAMIATYPLDWKQVKTWPIVGISLTAAGALNGKLIGDIFEKKSK